MHRSTALLTLLGLATALFAGCLGDDGNTDSQSTTDDPEDIVPHVVVAVIDTGVNPYHSEFAEQYDDRDPAMYIPGYPEDVPVLALSPWNDGAGNRDDADTETWNTTEPRTLYRYNGTKIVGHISFGGAMPGSGHGTMTASRATGNSISVGGPAVRLVVVQGFTIEAIEWAADQDWIDMISISSGISLGGLVPGAANAENQAGIEAFQYAAHKKPFFASSGNGLGNAGVAGFPAWTRGPSGAPDVISVGANENGNVAVWHNFHPYIVGDGCGNPSAQDNTADAIDNTGGGTSSATPFSAGTGAALLLEARRLLGDDHVGVRFADAPVDSFRAWDSLGPTDDTVILAQGEPGDITTGPLADGVFTLQEFKDVLYHTALSEGTEDESDGDFCTTTATGVASGEDVPYEARVQYQGYGEVNAKSLEPAVEVLAGTQEVPDRPDDDEWYAYFHEFRTLTYLGSQ